MLKTLYHGLVQHTYLGLRFENPQSAICHIFLNIVGNLFDPIIEALSLDPKQLFFDCQKLADHSLVRQ